MSTLNLARTNVLELSVLTHDESSLVGNAKEITPKVCGIFHCFV